MISTVNGSDGREIGGVGDIYLDDETGAPEWVTVATGLFGGSERGLFGLRASGCTDGHVRRDRCLRPSSGRGRVRHLGERSKTLNCRYNVLALPTN